MQLINYVSVVTSNLLNCSFKISKNYVTQKIFLKNLVRLTKDENKTGKVWLLQMKVVTMVILPKF